MARVTRIFLDHALSIGSRVDITGQAAHHLLKVLRARLGDRVALFNGDGREFSGDIVEIARHSASVLIDAESPAAEESPLRIILGQCISRGQRMDVAVQKAVELGVGEIVPLSSDRSYSMGTAKAIEKKLEHWRAIVISACEQSGRGIIPTLHPVTYFKDFIEQRRLAGQETLIPSPTATATARELAPPKEDSALAIAIGPEGGFSEEELEYAEKHEARLISLGPRVLRTETATIATLSLVQGLWGDC
ncbi:MAG: 16S rRNA (uracil(1498)-N(3))-methyltransferase [Gammaproteobacteria bacterium]